MKNYRKFILGVLYLAAATFLFWKEIEASQGKADWTGFGVALGGLASGVAALVWGYNKEHEFSAKAGTNAGGNINPTTS